MENKELLLKVLCDGLPYGMMIQFPDLYYPSDLYTEKLYSIDADKINDLDISFIKPHLRDMEDMTAEEQGDLLRYIQNNVKRIGGKYPDPFSELSLKVEWLNKKHFNWRGLPKNEYIRVTKENNPYKE